MGAFTKDLFIRYLFVPFFRGLVWTIATDTELNNCYLEVYNVELFSQAPFKRRISHVPNLTPGELNAWEVRRLNQLNSIASIKCDVWIKCRI